MKVEIIHDVATTTPPAGVVAATIMGIPVTSWVLWLNLLYIVLVIGWKVCSIYKETKNGKPK